MHYYRCSAVKKRSRLRADKCMFLAHSFRLIRLFPSHKHFFPPSLCTKTSHGHKPAKLNQVTSLLEISDRLFLVMASLCHFFVRPPLQTAICYHSTVITAGHALAYGALPQRKCNEDLFCYFGSFSYLEVRYRKYVK